MSNDYDKLDQIVDQANMPRVQMTGGSGGTANSQMWGMNGPQMQRLTSAERAQALQRHIYACVGNGARVEYQASPHDVVLVWGKNPNHILHLLLSLATFGLWVPFWILIACTMKEKREVRHVDDWGNVGITQR